MTDRHPGVSGADAAYRSPPGPGEGRRADGLSEFETARGGIWRICAVIDYATKYCLAATVTPTSRGQEALGCLRRAVVEAERVLEPLTCDGPDRLRRAWLG
jgi:putative transposase